MGHTDMTAEVIEFARACGQHRPVQLVLNQFGEGEPTPHRLERPFVLIGRAAECDIRLRHPEVSYRHAYLQIVDGRALCVDLASRTGTRWKTGTKSYGWIEPGEDVGIGPFELSYRGEQAEKPGPPSIINEFGEEAGLVAESAGSVVPASLPEAALEFLNGRDASGSPRRWPLRRSVTLAGSSPACNVQLRHDSVSKVHSSFVLTSGGLWVIDLLGRHGTRVNGMTVRCARLNDGDELRIGRFRMVVRLGAPAGQRAAGRGALVRRKRAARKSEMALANGGEPASVAEPGPAQAAAARSSPKPPANGAAPPAERIYSEAFILGLMRQFAAMQQHALAQTQQQITMLVELFSSIHQSQQELIREELARVHEINERLLELQGEMARQRTLRYLTERAEPATTAGDGAPCSGPSSTETAQTDEFPSESPIAEPSDSTAVPEAGAETSDAVDTIAPSEAAEADEDASDVRLLPDESCDDEDAQAESGDRSSTVRHPDADAHAWVAEQMHRLEREREGRWRKVLRVVGAGRL